MDGFRLLVTPFLFDMLVKLDHVGIAVKDLRQAIQLFETAFGLHCERIEEVAAQKVRVAFIKIGDTQLELLEPIESGSAVANFIQKRGEGIHHLAFQTSDVAEQIAHARQAGCRMINDSPVEGADGKKIAFAHPASTCGVLVELCSGHQPLAPASVSLDPTNK